MATWTREEVMRKIQALFRLAGNNPSEAEAGLAAERAQALLREYNLSMSEVELKQETSDICTAETESFRFTRVWIRSLAWSVSQMTDTFTYREKRRPQPGKTMRDNVIKFVGTKMDIEAALNLFRYLHTTIALMTLTSEFRTPSARSAYADGVAARIAERAAEFKREEAVRKAAEEQRVRAIVLVKKTAIDQYMKASHVKLRAFKDTSTPRQHTPYEQGRRDGEGVSLHNRKELEQSASA